MLKMHQIFKLIKIYLENVSKKQAWSYFFKLYLECKYTLTTYITCLLLNVTTCFSLSPLSLPDLAHPAVVEDALVLGQVVVRDKVSVINKS